MQIQNNFVKTPQLLLLKVRQFQNEFMKSSFLPKYKRKIVRISALCSEGRIFDNFRSYSGRNDDFINSFIDCLTFNPIPTGLGHVTLI